MKLGLFLIMSVGLIACRGPEGIQGAPGSKGQDGSQGVQGLPGPAGSPGLDGEDGTDGTNGADGRDATLSPYTPVGLFNPCGDAAGVADEILIQLANGQIVVSYSDTSTGKNTRFAVLEPGHYKTTDGDRCYFTVNADGSITNEHH